MKEVKMILEKEELKSIDESRFNIVKWEAYDYGVYRGIASAIGDKYCFMGPDVDVAIKDYLKKKFGFIGEVEIEGKAKLQVLLGKVGEGFSDGYEKEKERQIDEEERLKEDFSNSYFPKLKQDLENEQE